jgi:hypothetical protein
MNIIAKRLCILVIQEFARCLQSCVNHEAFNQLEIFEHVLFVISNIGSYQGSKWAEPGQLGQWGNIAISGSGLI